MRYSYEHVVFVCKWGRVDGVIHSFVDANADRLASTMRINTDSNS
jgi:hypothetical protein